MEQFESRELLHHTATLSWSNTKESWYGKPHPRNDSNRSPSLPRRHARRSDRRAAPAHRRDALALQGAGRRSVAGRAVGAAAGTRPLLGDRSRLAHVRGETERAAAIQDRDR